MQPFARSMLTRDSSSILLVHRAVFEKADDVYNLLSAADKTLDRLDRPLHDWDCLRPSLRLPGWMRYLYG